MRIESMPFSKGEMAYVGREEKELNNLVKQECGDRVNLIVEREKVVYALLADLKYHDEKTFLHSLEVGNIVAFLISNLKGRFTEREEKVLLSSALLHDYGKTYVKPEILNKEDSLTSDDFLEIKKHPAKGFDTLREWDDDVARVIVSHHEHQDNAYPRENSLENIPVEKRNAEKMINRLSRIIAMVDTFQAMLDSARPSNVHKPKNIDDVINELDKNFALNEDKEMIFLLETYYYNKLDNGKFKNQIN